MSTVEVAQKLSRPHRHRYDEEEKKSRSHKFVAAAIASLQVNEARAWFFTTSEFLCASLHSTVHNTDTHNEHILIPP